VSKATTSVDSVSGFIAWVKENCSKRTWLFRGLDDDVSLLPSTHRKPNPIERDKEEHLFHKFKRQAVRMVDNPPQTDLDWIALARHHGLPTRVLDWTADPIVALWFALSPGSGEPKDPRVRAFPIDDNDVIQIEAGQYIALPSSENTNAIAQGQKSVLRDPFSGRGHAGRTLLFVPEPVSPRIVAQQGWLMLFATPKDALPTAFEKNDRYKDKIATVLIGRQQRDQINVELRDRGIDRALLFPDLDNRCRALGEQANL